MLGTEIVIREFAQSVVDGIRNNIRTRPVTKYGAMNNTGKAADSLFWRYDGYTLEIGSTWKYITILEDGRKPGPVSKEGQDNIREWVRTKINPTDISVNSLAYLITRKITESGSLLYQQGGNSGIISDYINDEYIKENLTDKLRELIIESSYEILFG